MKRTLLLSLLFTGLSLNASAGLLYSNDFDGSSAFGTGISFVSVIDPSGTLETAAVGSWNASGWSRNYYVNRTTGDPAGITELTFGGLAPHSTVSLGFILGFLERWDSYDGGCCAPDQLDIYIDGVSVATLTATNALGTIDDYDGATELAHHVEVNGVAFYSDSLIDAGTIPAMTFAHTGATLSFGIQASGAGWQGSSDEAWGIDNLVFSYDGERTDTPAPAALTLLGLGLSALGLLARRRNV